MIVHVAKQLKAVHDAGYAHRDLKPENVMWLPSKNRWTIIDFGFAAPIDQHAVLVGTIVYAAPEVCAAFRSDQHSITVQACLSPQRTAAIAVCALTDEQIVL